LFIINKSPIIEFIISYFQSNAFVIISKINPQTKTKKNINNETKIKKSNINTNIHGTHKIISTSNKTNKIATT